MADWKVATIPLRIFGCSGCSARIQDRLEQISGVKSAGYNPLTESVSIRYDAEKLSASDLEAVIERLGLRLANKTYPPWWQFLLIKWRKNKN